jgi:hypothetical protein
VEDSIFSIRPSTSTPATVTRTGSPTLAEPPKIRTVRSCDSCSHSNRTNGRRVESLHLVRLPIVLILGPSGAGKTSASDCIRQQLGFHKIDFDRSTPFSRNGLPEEWEADPSLNGQRIDESTGFTKYDEARDLLKKREGAIADGVPITAKSTRLTFDDAAKNVDDDYTINKKK